MKTINKELVEEYMFRARREDQSFSIIYYSLSPQQLERFAELIVRECVGCCEQVISDPVPESVDTWLNGGSQCIDEIKQHFGVEE